MNEEPTISIDYVRDTAPDGTTGLLKVKTTRYPNGSVTREVLIKERQSDGTLILEQ